MGKYGEWLTVFLLIWARCLVVSWHRPEGRNVDRISLTVFFSSVLPLYPHSYPHTLSPYHTALCHTPAVCNLQPPATEPGPSDCQLITTSNLRLSSWRVSSVRGSRWKQAQLRIDTQIAIARDQGCANVLQAWFRLDRLNFCARWYGRTGFWCGYWPCQGRLSTNGGKRTNFQNICTNETWWVWSNFL
jgi:hypothetical protein